MKNYRDEIIGDVTLCRSRRARRITVSVRPDGSVRLTYPWFGTQRDALAFLTQRREWVERVRAKLPPERLVPRDEATRRARIEALRHEAKEVLPERVATIADRLGMRYGRVTIRASRSKWASCSARNDLSLNLFMMLLPEHLRDFVIVHELCHTVHKNHSREFHALVDSLVGGREKELTRELRRHSTYDL